VKAVDWFSTVFVELVSAVEVTVLVSATVAAPPVVVDVTTVVLAAPPTVVVLVSVFVTTTVDEECPLLPAKYAAAPTTMAITITAPIRAVVPKPFPCDVTNKVRSRGVY
jgi:hypothetical protein